MGIMHRDVKPHNVMIDHDQRKVSANKSLNQLVNHNESVNQSINELSLSQSMNHAII